MAGFCKSATTAEIESHGFVLTPGRYVGAEDIEDDGEPFDEKMKRLTASCRSSSKRRRNWRRPFSTTYKGWDMANSKWRQSTWGDEITLEYGKALRSYDTERGLYRVFGSNGPIGWTSEILAKGPGVILGRKGAYRGVRFSQDPFCNRHRLLHCSPQFP